MKAQSICGIALLVFLHVGCNSESSKSNSNQPESKEEKPVYDVDRIIAQYEGVFFARVKDAGKFYFINKRGERTMSESFIAARDFSEGLAAVKKGDLWGYVDPEGNTAIKFQFSEAGDFSNGVALVRSYGKDYVTDIHGTLLEQPKNKTVRKKQPSPKFYLEPAHEPDEYATDPISGAPLILHGLCGYANEKNEWVIQPKYSDAYEFHCVNGCGDYLTTESKPDNTVEQEKQQESIPMVAPKQPSESNYLIGTCATQNLRMREEGNMNAPQVTLLAIGEQVRILGLSTSDSITTSINGKDTKGVFLNVETLNGEKTGWVFSGGLKISSQKQNKK